MTNVNKPKIGRYVEQKEGYKTFTPFDFPPKGGFVVSPKLHKKHEEAIRLVGKLDGITRLLPDKDYFTFMFVIKDATYSSQIEGTKATMQDAVAAPVTEEKDRKSPDVDDIEQTITRAIFDYSYKAGNDQGPHRLYIKKYGKTFAQAVKEFSAASIETLQLTANPFTTSGRTEAQAKDFSGIFYSAPVRVAYGIESNSSLTNSLQLKGYPVTQPEFVSELLLSIP